MKILDMFGSGLPVCALDYGGAIGELVRDRENGFLFRSAEGLAELLLSCFEAFPKQTPKLAAVRANVAAERAVDWRSNWNRVARPIFTIGSPRAGSDSPSR
jgi:beta-1,4-mannosyltransferase